MLGALLRGKKQVLALSISGTLSDSNDGSGRADFGLPTVLRFARFRVIGISLALMGVQVCREAAQIAKAWPFSVPALRGRAPALSAAINRIRVFPQPHTTINNAETRDLGSKARGGRTTRP